MKNTIIEKELELYRTPWSRQTPGLQIRQRTRTPLLSNLTRLELWTWRTRALFLISGNPNFCLLLMNEAGGMNWCSGRGSAPLFIARWDERAPWDQTDLNKGSRWLQRGGGRRFQKMGRNPRGGHRPALPWRRPAPPCGVSGSGASGVFQMLLVFSWWCFLGG